jgi:hypothetical protein
LIKHGVRDMLRQRVYGLVFGLETSETGVRGHSKHHAVSGSCLQRVQVHLHEAVMAEEHFVAAVLIKQLLFCKFPESDLGLLRIRGVRVS